jgi:hypothetical protein
MSQIQPGAIVQVAGGANWYTGLVQITDSDPMFYDFACVALEDTAAVRAGDRIYIKREHVVEVVSA